jgi:Vacuolar membrane-associated protein Iml1, N-terminal domain/IML1 N-terminal double psi beta barrel domain
MNKGDFKHFDQWYKYYTICIIPSIIDLHHRIIIYARKEKNSSNRTKSSLSLDRVYDIMNAGFSSHVPARHVRGGNATPTSSSSRQYQRNLQSHGAPSTSGPGAAAAGPGPGFQAIADARFGLSSSSSSAAHTITVRLPDPFPKVSVISSKATSSSSSSTTVIDPSVPPSIESIPPRSTGRYAREYPELSRDIYKRPIDLGQWPPQSASVRKKALYAQLAGRSPTTAFSEDVKTDQNAFECEYDVFLCHAPRDKCNFALTLYLMLTSFGMRVFLHEVFLKPYPETQADLHDIDPRRRTPLAEHQKRARIANRNIVRRALHTSRLGVILVSHELFRNPDALREARTLCLPITPATPLALFYGVSPTRDSRAGHGFAHFLSHEIARIEVPPRQQSRRSLMIGAVLPQIHERICAVRKNIIPLWKVPDLEHLYMLLRRLALDIVRDYIVPSTQSVPASVTLHDILISRHAARPNLALVLESVSYNLQHALHMAGFRQLIADEDSYALFAEGMLESRKREQLDDNKFLLAHAASKSAHSSPMKMTAGSPGRSHATSNDDDITLTDVANADANLASRFPKIEYVRHLTIHDRNLDGKRDPHVIVNPTSFPEVKLNDILEISQPQELLQGSGDRSNNKNIPRLLLQVCSLEPIKGTLEISVLKIIADRFKLQSRMPCMVKVVRPENVGLDFIEIMFVEQYISRSDMWRFKKQFVGQCVYYNQMVTHGLMRAQVNEMMTNDVHVSCGLITAETKFVFRSKSARCFWLVQLSDEMWNSADDGEEYFEKFIGFAKILFSEWKRIKANHSLSIIFFSRTFYDEAQEAGTYQYQFHAPNSDSSGSSSTSASSSTSQAAGAPDSFGAARMSIPAQNVLQRDQYGRLYQDHYKQVYNASDLLRDDKWDTVIATLKREFNQYSSALKWSRFHSQMGFYGTASTAAHGNLLEAMNLCLTVFDKHYIDREINRMGQSIVVFSAGSGQYYVDRHLALLTKQRMVDTGIGSDLICVTRRALHVTPLFVFKRDASFDGDDPDTLETALQDLDAVIHTDGEVDTLANNSRFHIPHWLQLKFFDYQDHLPRQFGDRSGNMIVASTSHVANRSSTFRPLPTCRFSDHEQPLALAGYGTRTGAGTRTEESYMPFHRDSVQAIDIETYDNNVFNLSSDGTGNGNVPVRRGSVDSFRSNRNSAMRQSESSPNLAGLGGSFLKDGNFSPPALDSGSPFAFDTSALMVPGAEFTMNVPPGRPSTASSVTSSKALRQNTTEAGADSLLSQSPEEHGIRRARSTSLGDASYKRWSSQRLDSEEAKQMRRAKWENINKSEVTPASVGDGDDTGMESASMLQIQVAGVDSSQSTSQSTRRNVAERKSQLFTISQANSKRTVPVLVESLHTMPRVHSASNLQSLRPRSPGSTSPQRPGSSNGRELTRSGGMKAGSDVPSSAHHASSNSITSRFGRPMRNGPVLGSEDIVNPFKVRAYVPTMTPDRRRWSHLFATIDTLDHPDLPNWKSLVTPAILPLTTDYFPSTKELNSTYLDYVWTLDASGSLHGDNESLLIELVCQRLAQDYQIAMLQLDAGMLSQLSSAKNQVSDPTLRTRENDVLDDVQNTYLLSFHNEFHKISYDRSEGSIEVRRYIKARDSDDSKTAPVLDKSKRSGRIPNKKSAPKKHALPIENPLAFPYRYFLWSDHTRAYMPMDRDIAANHDIFAWNTCDQMLTDTDMYDEFDNSLKYRRQRFTLAPPAVPARVSVQAQEAYTPPSLSRLDLQDAYRWRVEQADAYHATCQARQEKFVEMMERLFELKFDQLDIKTVDEHAFHSTTWGDLSNPSTLGHPHESERTVAVSNRVSSGRQSYGRRKTRTLFARNEAAQGFNCGYAQTNKRIFRLSDKTSTRSFEWIVLEYDQTFDPSVCYHIEVQWLAASGVAVANWIKNKLRQNVQRFGFTATHQVPTTQPLRTSDPFHLTYHSPLHPSCFRLIEVHLLSPRFSFVLDDVSSINRQYLHRSGMAMVRVVSDGLLWINNNLTSAADKRVQSVQLYRDFRHVCQRLNHAASIVHPLVKTSLDRALSKLLH